MKYADLHVHSLASDGTYSAKQLVKEALSRKLCSIAIVDHDTVDIIPQAIQEAKTTSLEIIPGIELTSQCANQEIHILGYFVDYENKPLLEKLKLFQQNRIERVVKIVDNLGMMGLKLDPKAVFDISDKASVGRMHIARAMVKAGCVDSVSEAFRRYIGDKSPAYVLGFKITPREAIKIINDAGGVAVLAHPYMLKEDSLIEEFAAYGLQGLEVYYPEHSQSMINFYLEKAKRMGLAVTGGSDFHGAAKPGIKLGAVKISYELVDKLRRLKK